MSEHKCWVGLGLFDRREWRVVCRSCGYRARSLDRGSALDSALGHWYFARTVVLSDGSGTDGCALR